MLRFLEKRGKTPTPHTCLTGLAAGVTAAAIALAAALVPPATHTAHAADAVPRTVEVSDYSELQNVVERIGENNDWSDHTIVVKGDIAFDQAITLGGGSTSPWSPTRWHARTRAG